MAGLGLWFLTPLLLLWTALSAGATTHVPLIGVPKQLSFHYLTTPRLSRQSAPAVLLTATEASVLAAVNPSTGQISWRHQLEGLQGFDAEDDRVCAWQSHRVSCFEAGTGYLIWDQNIPSADALQSLVLAQQSVTAWTNQTVYAFSSTGEPLAPVAAAHTVALLEHNRAVSLDPTSKKISARSLSDPAEHAELSSGHEDFVLLKQGIVVLKKGALTSVCPDAASIKKTNSRSLKSSNTYTSLQRLSSRYLLGFHSAGKADIIRLDEAACQLEAVNSFKDSTPDAVYHPSFDRAGDLQVSRLAYSDKLHLGLLTIYSTTLSKWGDKGYIQGSTLPLKQGLHGSLVTHATEVAPPENKDFPQTVSRSVWVTSSGHLASSFGGAQTPAWVREEGLATLSGDVDPVWLDVSRERLSHAIPPNETPLSQVLRYAGLLRDYVVSLPTDLWWYVLGVDAPQADSGLDPLTAQFGFKKLAVVASDRGKVYALDLMTKGPPLDLGNTHIVWQTFLGAGSKDVAPASEIKWSQMVLDSNSKILLLGSKGPQTWAWELDAQTGKVLSQRQLGSGAEVASFVVASSATEHAVASVGKDHQIEMFPALPELSKAVYYTTQDERSVKGWQVQTASKTSKDIHQWTFALPSNLDETVYSVIAQRTGSIASLGRIMGNRSTLYKYLNPNLFLLTTLSETSRSASIYLIDAVSGNTVWYTTHEGEVDTKAGVAATLTENWLVYSFRDVKSQGKPTRIVSVELYEDWEPKQDPKRKKKKKPKFQGGKHLSSFDLREYPIFESRSFIAPFAIKSMSTSSTRLGVTTKSLLVNIDTNALISIPRPLLDPRRPVGQASKAEQEERLVVYDPVIPLEPKWIVSEGALVLSSSKPLISSTSTLLESTSLVLMAGLDLFCGRIAPSGTFDLLREDFNKLQLMLTIGGLALGVAVAKPLAERKSLKSKWYTQ